MALKLETFAGIAPKVSPNLLEANQATVAQNLRVDRGCITPLKAPTLVTSMPGTAKSIFYYDDGAQWIYWNTAGVDAVLSPVNQDAYQRFYWTGESYPMYSYQNRPSSGAPNGFKLGVPKPGLTASLSKSGTPSGTPSTRYYVYCYVSAIGEEGPPSSASASISVATGETVTVTFSTESLGAYNLGTGAMRRIYRTAQGTSSTTYEFVADVPIATLTYADSLLDTQLGEIIPSVDWYPPPTTMAGLKAHPNGFLVGFTGNTLCVSEQYLPHAWNPSNQLSFPAKITALAITGDSIIVFTARMPYLVTGTDPKSLTSVQIDVPQTCPAKASVVDMGGYAMFGSPDGLCIASANEIKVATESLLTRDQWQAYSPTTLRGFFYEGIYIGFTDAAAFMFDPRGGQNLLVSLSGYNFIAGYTNLKTDTLYLLDSSGNIYSWETGTGGTAVWKSKPVRMAFPACPSCMRVFATGTVNVKLWADGALKVDTNVTDNGIVRLPSGYRAIEFQAQFTASGSAEIQSVAIANSPQELV